MSKTELEEDLRATFERAAASVPLAPDLAGRATGGARQAQRRTWIASGAAAAAVAAIAIVGFSLNGPSSSPTPVAGQPAAPATTSASAPAVSAQTVAGTWRAVQMSGFATLKQARPDDPTLVFKADGTWTGSDGCNGISGSYTIGQNGEFTARAGAQRLVGCDNVPHTEILQLAQRISIDETALRFFTPDGREVARYARAG